jgi:predicted amidohydrolase
LTNNKRILSYKAAAVQFEPELGNLEQNRRRMMNLAYDAVSLGAKLIVFPEMATSGYVWRSREEIAPFVETIPGKTTSILTEICQSNDCYIATGLPEVDINGSYYNSAVLVGPDGVVGTYRKTHLFSADSLWAREGKDEISVFNTPIGRIALLICMDAMYFEPSRIAALKGANIIAFPTNWVGKGGNKPPSNTWRLRAKENGLYWIASNRYGTERGAHFTGGSGVIGPSGEVLESLINGEGIVMQEITISNSAKNSLVTYRKPKSYQEILLNPYLWKEGETRVHTDTVPFDLLCLSLKSFSSLHALKDYIQSYLREYKFNSENRLMVLSEIHFQDGQSIDIQECQNLLRDISEENGLFIVSSYTESTRYNSNPICFTVGPKGCIGQYQQVHKEESSNASFLVVELPYLRVGLLNGMDAKFPESYRVLAKLGADMITISTNHETLLDAWAHKIRAYENDVALAVASPAISANSMIFLHSHVAIESSQAGLFLHHYFDPEVVSKMRERPFLRRLNHHLYDLLVEDIQN